MAGCEIRRTPLDSLVAARNIATISVAEAVHPKTGTNWEGTGVTPDIQATAAQAGTSPAISPSRT